MRDGNEGFEREGAWPALPLEEWRGTRDTLHRASQMIGKTALALAPPSNHWWHTALQVGARGLATGSLPVEGGSVEVRLDLVSHALVLEREDARAAAVPLALGSVRAIFDGYRAALAGLGVEARIWSTPVEVPDPIPFEHDDTHGAYDPAAARRFLAVLHRVQPVLRTFAGGFVGKQSPVHFFWGSFDLALSRFSGRRAPERPGADPVTREASSHEDASFGFWPGGELVGGLRVDEPIFYAYAAPEPAGFRDTKVLPAEARWDERLSEFVLPYEAVRTHPDPAAALLAFCRSTFAAAEALGGWDRAALDRPDVRPIG